MSRQLPRAVFSEFSSDLGRPWNSAGAPWDRDRRGRIFVAKPTRRRAVLKSGRNLAVPGARHRDGAPVRGQKNSRVARKRPGNDGWREATSAGNNQAFFSTFLTIGCLTIVW